MDTLNYVLAGLCLLMGIISVAALMKSRGMPDVRDAIARFEAVQGQRLEELRRLQAESAAALRQELVGLFKMLSGDAGIRIEGSARSNAESMERLRAAVEAKLKEISDMTERRLEQMRRAVDERLSDTLQTR
jgi:DNA anti-recombination protein RmuC